MPALAGAASVPAPAPCWALPRAGRAALHAAQPQALRAAQPHAVRPERALSATPVERSPAPAPAQRAAQPGAAPAKEGYGPGVQLAIGQHRFRCTDALGQGSYGEVWRAQVLSGPSGLREVALKEVRCASEQELHQAVFEVQVMLALERAWTSPSRELRAPRCIEHGVHSCAGGGWAVRTAMTVIPGEPINCFVERSPPPRARPEALRRGCALARRLICDVGPTLEALAPVAWHRDVNPHNILIASAGAEANFWLIDFGLAVDSQSWVGSEGGWRAEYIGGDSRYWPPSSWVMHLLGPDGLDDSPDLCDQYQRRLDVHGLGITALELICSLALRAPAAGAEEVPSSWEPVLQAWASYRESVWQWWALVYHAFSTGADIAPVQAGLLQEGVVEKLVALLARARGALRSCAEQLHGRGEEEDGRLLCTVADMLDEAHAMDIAQAYGRLASTVRALPADRVLRPAPPASSPAAAAPAARQAGALGAHAAAQRVPCEGPVVLPGGAPAAAPSATPLAAWGAAARRRSSSPVSPPAASSVTTEPATPFSDSLLGVTPVGGAFAAAATPRDRDADAVLLPVPSRARQGAEAALAAGPCAAAAAEPGLPTGVKGTAPASWLPAVSRGGTCTEEEGLRGFLSVVESMHAALGQEQAAFDRCLKGIEGGLLALGRQNVSRAKVRMERLTDGRLGADRSGGRRVA